MKFDLILFIIVGAVLRSVGTKVPYLTAMDLSLCRFQHFLSCKISLMIEILFFICIFIDIAIFKINIY